MLGCLLVLLCAAGYYGSRFSFDASSDTLVVQGDPDLAAYLRIAERFGSDEFLLLTFTPAHGGALDPDNLAVVRRLDEEISLLPGVSGVFSILDAPLLESPPVPLSELAEGFRTLESPDVDRRSAQRELTESPLFSELLITPDGETSAMRIDLSLNDELLVVDEARAALRARQRVLQEAGKALPAEAQAQLASVEARHQQLRDRYLQRRDSLIAQVREIRDRYRSQGTLYLGGVPMIAADMIDFVRNDLLVFGSSVVLVVMIMLYWFFRRLRWVLLPIAASALTVACTVGVLGAVQRPATVVSSNFVSLLAIITISLIIHLIVRYRELLARDEGVSPQELVRRTMLSKFAPCLYNSLTTMAAFGSLMASHIVPVEDFGWMMCLGIAIGFFVTFTFFPAVLLLLPPGRPGATLNRELALTRVMSHLSRWRYVGVVAVAALWALAAAGGIERVSMDNRFIDYFHRDTDINQGMRFIDAKLGGTVPFDVVVRFAPYEAFESADDDFFAEESETYPERYWFTRDKLDRLARLHRYLENRPEVGKVVSMHALDQVATDFNDGERLSSAEIAGVLGALPDDLRGELIAPYGSPETGQLRLNARVIESGPPFDRAELARDIRGYAEDELGFVPDEVEITGMMVLFDSMLKQLLSSQVNTLAYVLLATFTMFLILLRSVLYAVLGLIPNMLAAASVLAIMGYAGIPLDMMTITIAAVSIGIGVDDAIHYLHRFKEEREKGGDVRLAVAWSHATIGSAMYFTSLTVIVGFSVLALSNFVPTILFGLLVAAAMVLALFANLTLLPSLLVLCLAPRRPRPPKL